MPDWDVSLVTSMSELVLQQRIRSTRIYRDGTPRASRPCTRCSEVPGRSTKISVHGTPRASRPWVCTRWFRYRYRARASEHVPDVPRASLRRYMGYLERHDHVRDVPRGLRVQPAPIEMGRQLGHDHGVHVLRRQRIQHDAGGLGHIQSHGFYRIFYSAAAWYARFEGGGDDTLPSGGWTRKDNACDASLPPVNGAVGTCTDTLVSGTSCVPTCDAGYCAEGRDVVHRPGADRGGFVRLAVYRPRRAEGEPWTLCLDAVPSGRGAAPRTRCVGTQTRR